MSATEEQFFRKFGKRWKMITREEAYKDAVDTAQRVHPAFKIIDKSPAEIQGAGNLMVAQQQSVLQLFDILDTLAAVPPEYTELDEPPESDRYPDPMEEFAEQPPQITKRRK